VLEVSEGTYGSGDELVQDLALGGAANGGDGVAVVDVRLGERVEVVLANEKGVEGVAEEGEGL